MDSYGEKLINATPPLKELVRLNGQVTTFADVPTERL